MSRSAASPDPVRGWDEMASILLPFLPRQHKPVCASQPERNMPFCPSRSRSKRVLPGGLVLPRHGSIHWGSTTGKTPQGWKKKDETGSIQGGRWKMGVQALLLLVTPGESLLCIKPLRWERKQSPCRQGALPVALSTSNWWLRQRQSNLSSRAGFSPTPDRHRPDLSCTQFCKTSLYAKTTCQAGDKRSAASGSILARAATSEGGKKRLFISKPHVFPRCWLNKVLLPPLGRERLCSSQPIISILVC